MLYRIYVISYIDLLYRIYIISYICYIVYRLVKSYICLPVYIDLLYRIYVISYICYIVYMLYRIYVISYICLPVYICYFMRSGEVTLLYRVPLFRFPYRTLSSKSVSLFSGEHTIINIQLFLSGSNVIR